MPVLTKINTNVIADDAVTAAKIPADALGATDIAANAVGSSEIADEAVTPAKIAYLGDGTGKLSGTITGQQLRLGTAFTLTDDLTVNGDLTLSKVRADGTGQSLTQDSSANRTLTGTGTLRMGHATEKTSISGFTGVLDSAVTGGAGLNKVSGIHLRTTYYTSAGSGVWVKPSDTVSIRIKTIAGGGGGGGGSDAGDESCGSGGSAGGYAELYIATAAPSYAYVVGAAGAAGSAGGAGGAGGATTIAGIAGGGGNPGDGTTTATHRDGAIGTTPTGGDINVRGNGGGNGYIKVVGLGGSSYLGGSYAAKPGSHGTASSFGCGGSGGGTAGGNGGAGGVGYIEIREYS